MPRIEILDLAPKDAVAHFRAKGYHVGFDHRDTSAAQHLASFTVAKVAQIDILQDIRKAVDAAIADGWTFERFRKELEPLLRKKGWWGRQPMIDPLTGETRMVQLGSPRRLRIIFDTNLRMAYARGHWQAIERRANARPWLRYVAILDERTRPDHARWHGTVLRWDHPAWQTHYPPCGWNCRCTVQQLSDRDLDRLGFKPSKSPPEDWGRTRPWRNTRTGETIEVPIGIDPGFQHNAGLLRPDAPADRILKERAAAAPDIAAAVTRPRQPEDWIAEGRTRRERMVEDAGGIDAPDFVERFRDDLRTRLKAERGAGTVEAQVAIGRGGTKTAGRVREAAKELPASWVTRSNTLPLTAIRGSRRGFLRTYHGNVRPAEISVAEDIGNPLHEYLHHLQRAIPELDGLFVALHRRRTKGEPRVQVGEGSRELGRKDQYIRPYTGKEYGPTEEPREVITMGMQQLFHPVWDREYLRELVRDDPEMLDLLLGVLFGYDP